MTVDAAAYSLGLSARTVRRRLVAAMEHFGVTNHFALGAAWSANGRDREPPAATAPPRAS